MQLKKMIIRGLRLLPVSRRRLLLENRLLWPWLLLS